MKFFAQIFINETPIDECLNTTLFYINIESLLKQGYASNDRSYYRPMWAGCSK